MAPTNLNQLAESYWQGQLSEAEEQELFRLLAEAESLPAELSNLRNYLWYAKQERETKHLSLDFDKKLMDQIHATQVKSVRRPLWPRLVPVAAAIALLIGIGLNWDRHEQPATAVSEEFVDTYEDPEEAYLAVKAALMKVSSTMNEGMAHSEMLTNFHQAQTAISSQE